MEKKVPELSLVVPVFNEGENVARIIGRSCDTLKKLFLNYEIIVVDDGSGDNTLVNASKSAKTNGVTRVVSYKQNRGKGFAIKTGFSMARGKYIVFMDGDLDIDPDQIGEYIERLKDGDIIIGSKRHPDSRVSVPYLRRFLSWSFNCLVRLSTGLPLKDTQSGLKAVRKRPLEKVFSVLLVKRFAFDVELLSVANMLGLRIIEMPIELRSTKMGFDPKDIFRMILDVLGVSYRLRLMKYYQRMMIFDDKAAEL